METFHIHIRGQVQGVGFRPFVYQLARRMGLGGWVSNTSDGVHIEINADAGTLDELLAALKSECPQRARIASLEVQQVPFRNFATFEIVQDTDSNRIADLLLSPDFALCEDCRREMRDPANRRFGYPFITCTLCGPRYSITALLPYDRERTSMHPFRPCPDCIREYEDPDDRRYFSQTNSCPTCGIQLQLMDASGRILSTVQEEVLPAVVSALQAGKIIALKGIGGYLLMVDAAQPDAILRLRTRKHRPSKPFAVLYPDLGMLRGDAVVSEAAINALTGVVSPIVLLPLQNQPASGIAADLLAPGLRHIGAMLPYAPLLESLMLAYPRPIVATSGNISHAPIAYREPEVTAALGTVADLLISHNRNILVPQDDSVLRFSPQYGQGVWLRRSRGLAPTLILPVLRHWKGNLLAMGADLKSAFALLHAGNLYMSQYLGDLDNWETQEHFRRVLDHLTGLCKARPEKVLADAHPNYFSRALAEEWSVAEGVEVALFQHHEAHFAAVLAENDLLDAASPVLGIVFDGTGWGRDGNIWGGEYFLFEKQEIRRLGHLAYFSHIAGDKMSREPRLPALAIGHQTAFVVDWVAGWFSPEEWQVYRQLLKRGTALKSCSMGRVFDAVAACCGFGGTNSFEGESALRLEEAALQWIKNNGWKNASGYICHWEENQLSVISLLEQVIADLRSGIPPGAVAAKFHGWVVNSVEAMALQTQPSGIAFSGGVFQNVVLLDLLRMQLGKRFRLFFHQELSPNDENIAFGQVALEQIGGHALKPSYHRPPGE